MSTGTGTLTDPIVAMSADPAQIARDVRESLAHFNRTDDPYWLDKESKMAQFSNGLWHLGHNRYWEARMDPTNTGSADPNLGKLPALYTLPNVPVPPLPDPPPGPGPSPETIASMTLKCLQTIDRTLFTLVTTVNTATDALIDLDRRVQALNGQLTTVQSQMTEFTLRPAPPYTGRLSLNLRLTPEPPKP
jgi:hypothetical protein